VNRFKGTKSDMDSGQFSLSLTQHIFIRCVKQHNAA